jgi:hypothetical protein
MQTGLRWLHDFNLFALLQMPKTVMPRNYTFKYI